MRRPGIWVANGHPGDPSQMLSWQPGALTSFYDYLGVNGVFDYKAAHPDADIIVRFQHPHNWHQNPEYYARQLGQEVVSKWSNMRRLDPYVYFANEMNLHYENGDPNPNNQSLYTTPDFYQRYANWVRLTADVIKNMVPEMKLVTPPFASGHHEDGAPDDDGHPKDGWAGFDYLKDTIRDYFDNIICFHGYWGHGAGSERDWLYDPALSTWYAFRWQRVLNLFKTRYNMDARIIIDEAGNFGASDSDFTDQVMYYAEKCLSDNRVLALTYFLWHDPTNSPGNVPNSWTQRVKNLPAHINRLRTMPDIPTIDDPDERPPIDDPDERPPIPDDDTIIRVLFDDGTVREMGMETYLRAVVPSEVPASWPIESLKAQSVAARSYAQYAIENPRHDNADICTNPAHCQNYDEGKIHPNTDQAIQQTQGIIARYNGATVNGIFSANCGGHTQNNEDVFQVNGRGWPVPYLRGVPCPATGEQFGHGVGFCQHGSRVFAEQGYTYDQIIRHYYTGATVGPTTPVRTSNILGQVLDHTRSPIANVPVILEGNGQSVEARTQTDGSFQFGNVPGGTYTLTFPDYNIQPETVTPTPGEDLSLTITLPAPEVPDLIVEVERVRGLPLILGDWGKANQRILIQTPSGQLYQLHTGHKPDIGVGGFEFYAPEAGIYTLEIEGHRFTVESKGLTTRLTFRHNDGASEPNGIIVGILRSYTNRPVPNRDITLKSDRDTFETITDQNGHFLFDQLPMGHYTIRVVDSAIEQKVIITGSNQVALALKFAEPPDTEEWQISLERGDGLPLLVGDIGIPNRPIVITSPSGVKAQLVSGHKAEYGSGGFELYTHEIGNYTIQFEDQRFIIPINGQFTHVTFEKVSGVDEQVRLVSDQMSRAQAETLLQTLLAANPEAVGLFEIQDAE